MSSRRDELLVETIKRGSFTGRIYYDDSPEAPHKRGDMLGTLITWHRRYSWQEDGYRKDIDPQEFIAGLIADDCIWIKVGLYDHSGLSMYSGGGPGVGDAAGWDSGTVGLYYTSRKQWELLMGDRPYEREKVEEALASEVDGDWNDYVSGNVYGYVIEGPDGEKVEDGSLWGIYGLEWATKELEEQLELLVKGEEGAIALEREHFAL